VIKNTGVVFAALNERKGALHDLVVNSNNVFSATASRDEALAQTFAIFPTFLDESRLTLDRLKSFALNTHPLVRDLKLVAKDLGPTVRNLGDLAPDLKTLFKDFDPLITAPNGLARDFPLGVIEPWDCSPNTADHRAGVAADGTQKDPQDGFPPCFEAPPSLWDGHFFPNLNKGKAPNVPKPGKFEGTKPA